MTRRAGLLVLAALLGSCRARVEEPAACTRVQAVREVQGEALCEDVWTCERPPGGPFDRAGLRRLAPCRDASGPVVLYLPGMHMNSRLPGNTARNDLRLHLAAAGFRTWGLNYRTHAVPADATSADLRALAGWTAGVFADDAAWAAAFASTQDAGPLFVAGFSYGGGLAYRLAARGQPLSGLVILDAAAPSDGPAPGGGPAIDVGGGRLPFAERAQLLAAVIEAPEGPSPLAGFPSAGAALADILWSASAFGGAGGLSAAREGATDVRVVARLLDSYDRWWPRAALAGEAPRPPARPLPVLAFVTTNMGPRWVSRVRESAEAFGGPQVTVRVLEGWGHLDVLVGRGAAREVFEPVRAWIEARAAR